MSDSEMERLVRLPEVMKRVGLSKTKVYGLMKRGDFPNPIKIGRNSVWKTSELINWMQTLQ
jgi:prophage regulatory protein